MFGVLIFLHVISAVVLGVYVLLPCFLNYVSKLKQESLTSVAGLLIGLTRMGQYALILLLLTGGAMMSMMSSMPSIAWLIITLVLFVIIGAVTGMLIHNIKRLKGAKATSALFSKVKVYSWIASIAIILIVLVMTNPRLFEF
ncbi:hypothetical protein GCM10011391_06860 [Pullulanibacillus camelliae]|uniref:DUF2269 family protein n=1 Tax=Pullulanibacillus camelliae TaxID=1707096 RepID=A0A8J2VLA0_9BACL|nr:hypothetical protein [Pullulanibacillus camelliae]GGE30861.1 hypothetical protein GCM10011391_06860 [Pullulanibacillus camelliae]